MPAKVLDVGCGIGGTSRYLAAKFPTASVTGAASASPCALTLPCGRPCSAGCSCCWLAPCHAAAASAFTRPAAHHRRVPVRLLLPRCAGITLSPNQVKRGTELAAERGLDNVQFKVRPVPRSCLAARAGREPGGQGGRGSRCCLVSLHHSGTLSCFALHTQVMDALMVGLPDNSDSTWRRTHAVFPSLFPCFPTRTQVMDALKMEFPDNSFDLVWACESGEHMPDKKAYVDEMVRRVLGRPSLAGCCIGLKVEAGWSTRPTRRRTWTRWCVCSCVGALLLLCREGAGRVCGSLSMSSRDQAMPRDLPAGARAQAGRHDRHRHVVPARGDAADALQVGPRALCDRGAGQALPAGSRPWSAALQAACLAARGTRHHPALRSWRSRQHASTRDPPHAPAALLYRLLQRARPGAPALPVRGVGAPLLCEQGGVRAHHGGEQRQLPCGAGGRLTCCVGAPAARCPCRPASTALSMLPCTPLNIPARPTARCATLQGTGDLERVGVADWTAPTIDSWRHSIWVGVWDPWIVVFKVRRHHGLLCCCAHRAGRSPAVAGLSGRRRRPWPPACPSWTPRRSPAHLPPEPRTLICCSLRPQPRRAPASGTRRCARS